MTQFCINHPDRPVRVKGLCMACYMKQRRAAKSGYIGRRPAGSGYAFALSVQDQWVDRFLGKIDSRGDCHIWRGTRNSAGYGVFHLADRTLLAHRLIRAMVGGDITAPVVMHTCDNPACVNPEHLVDGTHKANSNDMYAKGRQPDPARLGQHLKDRQAHPRARAVVTPLGEFASAALAAEAAGVSARTAQRWASRKRGGWRWA